MRERMGDLSNGRKMAKVCVREIEGDPVEPFVCLPFGHRYMERFFQKMFGKNGENINVDWEGKGEVLRHFQKINETKDQI